MPSRRSESTNDGKRPDTPAPHKPGFFHNFLKELRYVFSEDSDKRCTSRRNILLALTSGNIVLIATSGIFYTGLIRLVLSEESTAIAKASGHVRTAQEKVTRLQELAQNPTIYAQLDGIVTALNYKVGDTVVEGKPLCIVGELNEITITVPISASDIGSVSVGQKVNIYVDAYAEQKFTGTVKERFLVANDNGEYPVTISIDPGEQMLLPGMKAYATIILKEKKDVLTLSNKAITLENGQQYVLVRSENGELVRQQIVTGFSDGRVSEILDGLTENEVVIVQE